MSHPRPDPDELLAALGRAERQASPVDLGARIDARRRRPSVVARLPLGIAGGWRQVGALLQPAVAGSAVATAAGLALGTWLAISTQNGNADAAPSEPYDASALVGETDGLAARYLDDEEGLLGSSDAATPPVESAPAESGGAP